MNRRSVLSAVALGMGATVAGTQARANQAAPGADPGQASWRRFAVTTRVTLLDAPGAAQLWVPLAQTAGGYQASLDLRWETNGQARVTEDAKYGASILRIDWAGAASEPPKQAEVTQIVATRDRAGGERVLPVTQAERHFWLQSTESAPTDGIVRATAQRIIAGKTEPRAQLRAIYDWIVENTSRNPETPGCGLGDIQSMLESGNLSGKCADINGLMTGLARAAGLPARDVYGVRVAPSVQFRTLGAASPVSRAQHCRCEVYLSDTGWFPLDPADVRKVILDHKLPIESAEIQALRERLFGGWEMNWVGYNSATDIVLPDAMGNQKPNFAFLMYPCAFTSAGQPDCLDPSRFQYEITSRELTS